MSLVTIVYSMIAGVCLTLAAVHLPVWVRNREARASLAFAVAAICSGAIACGELFMLTATTPDGYATAQKWNHVPIALLLVALAAFGYQYLRAGQLWLALLGIGLRLVALAINFSLGENLNFLQVTALGRVPYMGEAVALAIGVRNPWLVLTQLDTFLLMLFFADASVTAWRHRRRTEALLVGGSLTLFMLASAARSMAVFWLGVQMPSMVSLFSLGVMLVTGYALSRDLLRARQLATALDERELQATLAAEAANLGTWSRDLATGTVRVSRKWRELFGFSPEEPLALPALLQRIHIDDRAAFDHRLAQATREGGHYHTELRLALPDGRTRWIAAIGRVAFDARGRALRTRGACIDITARKQQERETLRLRQDIAHVGRVSVMGQLASALAHEINQPLGAILRNAEAASLFMQDPSPDLAEITAILEDIRKDDQRAGAVIDRMRSLLRRQEVAMTELDLSQVLGDVAMLVRQDAAARHVAMHLEVAPNLPPVHGDRVQIQQVLLNLILNAMDALRSDGDRQGTVAVTARREGPETLEISVADTGCGIPAAQIDRVFDPFFTTKTTGIGMGLSISRSIVETHGGRLWAENNAVRGATFRFTLPVAAWA